MSAEDNQGCQNGCCQVLSRVWGNEEDDRIFSTADAQPINITYLARGMQQNTIAFADGCFMQEVLLPAGFSLECPHGEKYTQEFNFEFGTDFSVEE